MPGKFVLTKNERGQYHFVLKAANGETIAQSETYPSRAAAMSGIESVKANASGATIDDRTATESPAEVVAP
jgi:uncharacterized protein YegP (UPF0339 family)